MKTRIKLAFGGLLGAVAVMAASQTVNLKGHGPNDFGKNPCYSDSEVQLLMKAHHWSEAQAKTILDLACHYNQLPK